MAMNIDKEISMDRLCYMDIIKEECLEMLKSNGRIGSFLLRKSVSVAKAKVLSVLVDPQSADGIYSYLLIESTDGRLGLSSSRAISGDLEDAKQKWCFFDSLESLIKCCSGPNSPLKVALTQMIHDGPYVDMNHFHQPNEESDYILNDSNDIKIKKVTFEAEKAPEILHYMKCLVCKEFTVNAVETRCCYQLYCENCYPTQPDSRCNVCRMPQSIQVSGVLRRIIGNLPTVCSHNGCTTIFKRSELSNHEEKCDYRMKYCTFNGCQYACRKMEMMQHISTMHAEEAMARLEALSI